MVATVSYNTVLAVQYLMIIKLNIPEAYIEKKYERIMHGIPILVWLITGIIGIACGVFNPAFFNCWIMPDRECDHSGLCQWCSSGCSINVDVCTAISFKLCC